MSEQTAEPMVAELVTALYERLDRSGCTGPTAKTCPEDEPNVLAWCAHCIVCHRLPSALSREAEPRAQALKDLKDENDRHWERQDSANQVIRSQNARLAVFDEAIGQREVVRDLIRELNVPHPFRADGSMLKPAVRDARLDSLRTILAALSSPDAAQEP